MVDVPGPLEENVVEVENKVVVPVYEEVIINKPKKHVEEKIVQIPVVRIPFWLVFIFFHKTGSTMDLISYCSNN